VIAIEISQCHANSTDGSSHPMAVVAVL